MRNQHSRPKLPPQHRAKRAKGPGTRPWSGSRGETHCGYRAKPCRSLRQSLIRRKPTRCRFNEKQHIEVRYQMKVISEYKICTAFLSLSAMQIRKERSDFAVVGLAQIFVGGNSVRPCSEFVIISELQGDKGCRGVGTSGAPSPTSVIGQFFVLSYNGCNRGLVSSTGERCSPLQVCSRKIVGLVVFLFNFQVTFGV